MAHGRPDDSNIKSVIPVYVMQDLAELAARLGSTVVLDRRGSVIFMEDFGKGLGGWIRASSASSPNPTITNARSWFGGASALINPVIGDDEYATLSKYFFYREQGILALEWVMASTNNAHYIDVILVINLPTVTLNATIRIYPAINRIDIYDNDDDYVTLDDDPPISWNSLYPTYFRLSINTLSYSYIELIANYKVYDLSDYTLHQGGVSSSPTFYLIFDGYSADGYDGYYIIDMLNILYGE